MRKREQPVLHQTGELMKITEVKNRDEKVVGILTAVWEQSVKATHLFLSEAEIEKIAVYVPEALKSVRILLTAENERGDTLGFAGIENGKLEMLFLLPSARGKGIGRSLLQHCIKNYGVTELCVNEQNPQARGFYEHMGFQTYKRTDTDEQGMPYPILYMRLQER